MNKWKNYIPEGTKDILFEESNCKLEIINKARDVYIKRSYKEVITPTLEFYDVFSSNKQPIEQEKMYKLFDSKGRILVLRPDMTMPIARICASKMKDCIYPLKLCYNANVFRINESLNGKMNEMTQSGIEIIGTQNSKAEAEIITTAIEILRSIGITDFKIEIGQSEFYRAIIENININEEEIEKLRSYVEDKNYATLKSFLEENKDNMDGNTLTVLKKLPELFGDINIIGEAEKITNNKKALESLKSIKEIYGILDSIGLGKYIFIDLGMVQNIDYYTGIIFRGYISDISTEVLSGGRYDNLIEEFGMKKPATGLAMNVDVIMDALKNCKESKPSLIEQCQIFCTNDKYGKAYTLYEEIEKMGIKAELSLFDNEEKAIEYCKLAKINKLVSIEKNNDYKLWDCRKSEYKIIKEINKEDFN